MFITAKQVATKEFAGSITSSPVPKPRALKISSSASVPLLQEAVYLESEKFE